MLKYLGDGLLAIFRDGGKTQAAAREAALAAASGALRRLDEANAAGPLPCSHPGRHRAPSRGGRLRQCRFGQPARFHRDRTRREPRARIAQLNKALGEPLLMSHDFSERIGQSPEPLGEHALPGFDQPVAIYRPRGDMRGS